MRRPEVPLSEVSVIACSLSSEALQTRVEQWRAVGVTARRRESGPGWTRAAYPSEAAAALRRLVAAEAECCPDLAFDLEERDGEILVTMRFPVA